MKLTEEEIKECFLRCGNKNPKGLYHGEGDDALDLVEFANNITQYMGDNEYMRGKKDEHKRCVKLARQINPRVADFLLDKREYSEA